jgi:FkbM family methyltransferase
MNRSILQKIERRIALVLRKIKYRLFGTGRVVRRTNPLCRSHYFVREGTSDDIVERDIFYPPSYTKEDFGQPKFIIDAGANIGLRSLWFANLFPDAKIIAVEPETANYELCVRNTSSYPNITCIKAALWRNNSYLQITANPVDPQPWAFIVKECNVIEGERNNGVRGISITDIMQDYSIPFIDVLKIDVEGSEKEVFDNSADWIDSVGSFLMETHDRFRQGTAKSFFSAINHLDYVYLPEFIGNEFLVKIDKSSTN